MSETLTNYAEIFGFNPETIGGRHRAFWVVQKIEHEETTAGAELGDLCVKTRDNGIDYFDVEAARKPNYRGTSTDSFDPTYRYYYFSPKSNNSVCL